jgi:NAD(P)-dependent dehydrogenase (short-subunit alcohol dehydrogenase family)
MSKTIAVFGVGPGVGRSVARRFGQEAFQVALVARNQTRLDADTGELVADPALLPEPQTPADLADAMWDLPQARQVRPSLLSMTPGRRCR